MKLSWDIIIAITLIVCAIVIPYRVALAQQDDLKWTIINYTIDSVFLVDILMVFNTAYQDSDYKTIEDRCIIAK